MIAFCKMTDRTVSIPKVTDNMPFGLCFGYLGSHYIIVEEILIKTLIMALDDVSQLVGTLSHRPKGHGFNSQSGHTPRLWV